MECNPSFLFVKTFLGIMQNFAENQQEATCRHLKELCEKPGNVTTKTKKVIKIQRNLEIQ
jgi:hypothetical protein